MIREGNVSLRDGIRIELADGGTVVADAAETTGDATVLSHAHGDHLYSRAPEDVICSELTARLAAARREGEGKLARGSHPAIDQVPAGHVPGSSATIVEDDGTTYLYTGDFSPRDRFGLEGFNAEAVAIDYDIDVLVTETTYGKPGYVFDPQEALEERIVDWLDDTGRPVVLFGYTLGRAQELQRLAARSDRDRLFVTEAIERLNAIIEDAWDTDFGATRYRRETTVEAGDVLVLPAQTNKLSFVDRIVEETGAVTAGFSGWATRESFKYRGGYDETFVLSDHADFSELVATVETLSPEQVYTHHGFADAFVSHLETELGIEARSLKENQTSLGEF